jgi:signal transduction histidine kinase
VDRLLELSQTALREMRSLLFELRPVADGEPPILRQGSGQALTGPERVRRYGLLEALRALAADFSHDGVQVDVRTYEFSPTHFGKTSASGNETTIEQDIYRIVQEALNNAIKHAQAHEILVLLDGNDPHQLCLSISDDGIGFVPAPGEESQEGGFGMKTMRERAETVGGSLRVISAPGRGTTIEVTIPTRERKR